MIKKLALCEKGVSILELGIALPFLVILSYGTLEITLKINSLQHISAAAQEGVKVAASFRGGAVNVCPNSGRSNNPVSVVCPAGDKQVIPAITNVGEIARISTCNYLKDQGLDADNFLITTTLKYKNANGKRFPVIELQLQERDPSCTICINKLVSIIPGDSDASMSIQNCETI